MSDYLGSTNWAPPPPPPAKKGRSGLLVVAIVFGVLALLTTGIIIAVAQPKDSAPVVTTTTVPKVEKVTVHYSITLTDTLCYHEYDSFDGYSDITEGTEVEVFDGSGNLLGFGSLGECDLTTTYSATFPVKVSEDGVYRITLGNDNRGYVNYTQADVVDGHLYSEAELG